MSTVTGRLVELIEAIDNDALTLGDLSDARKMLGLAATALRRTDTARAELHETLRDQFAAAALTGIMAGKPDADNDHIGTVAYALADSMLKARGSGE